ncbi:retroviral-like aspartic protease family protein [Candidatus Dojkabacteria bacterium]|nr:retroviral-like aspartic protease family protein [Candidatus Dojkabacteria bacterium]
MNKFIERAKKTLWIIAFLGATIFFIMVMIAPSSVEAADIVSEIQLSEDGGIYTVPVILNGKETVECIVDSGASENLIPVNVIVTLKSAGTLQDSDRLEGMTVSQASGQQFDIKRLNIKLTQVGDQTVYNIPVGVGMSANKCLLGQSFFKRFNKWSIDNTRKVLILEGAPSNTPIS